MMTVRRWHGYIGALIAPSVLFFALTGAVQLFSLHEAHGGYTPPPILEKLASVHKDQVFKAGHHHGPPPGARPGPAAAAHQDDDDALPLKTALLKWFFLVVALGLAASTLLGVWIGVTRLRERRTTLALLAVGVILPLLLLLV